ncbi:MAG: ABC-2 transporter permease [Acutalibacteraceae bacterium]
MKGLLIKDFMLMKVQRNFFFVIIIMAVVMAFSMDNISFISGYMSFIIPLFVLSTISYDEFDNGSAFLFSLPVSRKGYVIEKYCFGVLLGSASLVLSIILSLCMASVKGRSNFSDILLSAPFIFLAMTVLLSIFIPVQIKFGSEKSRFVIIAVSGVIAALGYVAIKLLTFLKVDVEKLVNTVTNLNIGILLFGAAVLTLCVVLLSIKISVSILQKKEF